MFNYKFKVRLSKKKNNKNQKNHLYKDLKKKQHDMNEQNYISIYFLFHIRPLVKIKNKTN